jgi:hypothetical protein
MQIDFHHQVGSSGQEAGGRIVRQDVEQLVDGRGAQNGHGPSLQNVKPVSGMRRSPTTLAVAPHNINAITTA